MNEEEASNTHSNNDENGNDLEDGSANSNNTIEKHKSMMDQLNNVSFVHGLQTVTKNLSNHVKEVNYILFSTASNNKDEDHHKESAPLLRSPHPSFKGIIIDSSTNRSSTMNFQQY